RRFQSFSAWAKTRLSSVLLPASPDRAAMRPASIISTSRLQPSDWASCMSWCPKPFAWPCCNPANASSAESTLRYIPEAARAVGLQSQVLNASSGDEIDTAFAILVRERVDALFVAPDAFFNSRRVQFATLTARDRIPAAYADREIVEAGGLMSYGTDFMDMFRQVGVYVGRILKGAKPSDLRV